MTWFDIAPARTAAPVEAAEIFTKSRRESDVGAGGFISVDFFGGLKNSTAALGAQREIQVMVAIVGRKANPVWPNLGGYTSPIAAASSRDICV
jgi:hypothetical protein